ncbi:SDR family NAD(P)-dependent oxidoreductase [Pseudomonas mangiferae]|uniref:SDR family oxidoreductase n=1 Tax=Pseudomonas mangiferae TaxID=2593654 RepID=A0A553GXC4_9PSED|nr:SDR family oxidoreductase [Pseudomonas mangiferae]TRX74162.1 SDR family oxidoreductase [Pseudomonas mangiferae]
MIADMTGSVAVVLGGTKGIGRESVRKLAQSGAHVVIQGRDREAAEALIGACAEFPGERLFVASDLLTYAGIEAAVAAAHQRFGKVDVVVASGGPSEPRPKLFAEMTPEEGIACLQSRLMPRLNALHAAVKHMRGQGYGKVILVTTDAARIPTPSESMIGAAGASIMFLTRALAAELAGLGIRVNAVATTLTTDTPAHERFLAARDQGSQEVIVKAFTKAEQKVKFRLNTARDLAEYILYLASPESDQVSGSTLSINGGLSFPSY